MQFPYAYNTIMTGKLKGYLERILLVGVVYAENHKDINIGRPGILPAEAVNFGSLFSALVGLIIIVAFIAAFIYLIWGGFQWVTSGGDEAAVAAARGRITQALIGLVIVVAAWAIFQLIESFFGITVISGGGFEIPGLK
jgi:hypothetical protein